MMPPPPILKAPGWPSLVQIISSWSMMSTLLWLHCMKTDCAQLLTVCSLSFLQEAGSQMQQVC